MMTRKKNLALVFGFSALVFTRALAHDGGHGPRITESAQKGGVVAPVIDLKELKNAHHAKLVYKAELTRSEDGNIKIYLYDSKMKPLDISKFEKSAKAILEIKKKKNHIETPFSLALENDSFIGKAPKASKKPFNIEVTLKEGARELFVAFVNLD